KRLQLSLIEREPLRPDILAEIGANLADQVLTRKLFKRDEVELVNDPLMQLELLVEQGRPLRNQLAIDVLFCSRGGLAGDDLRGRLWPSSRRSIGEEAHLQLMVVFPRLVYKALALLSLEAALVTRSMLYWTILLA